MAPNLDISRFVKTLHVLEQPAFVLPYPSSSAWTCCAKPLTQRTRLCRLRLACLFQRCGHAGKEHRDIAAGSSQCRQCKQRGVGSCGQGELGKRRETTGDSVAAGGRRFVVLRHALLRFGPDYAANTLRHDEHDVCTCTGAGKQAGWWNIHRRDLGMGRQQYHVYRRTGPVRGQDRCTANACRGDGLQQATTIRAGVDIRVHRTFRTCYACIPFPLIP